MAKDLTDGDMATAPLDAVEETLGTDSPARDLPLVATADDAEPPIIGATTPPAPRADGRTIADALRTARAVAQGLPPPAPAAQSPADAPDAAPPALMHEDAGNPVVLPPTPAMVIAPLADAAAPVGEPTFDAVLAGLGAVERTVVEAHLASLTPAPVAPIVPTNFAAFVAGLGAAERTLVEAHLATLTPPPAAPTSVPQTFDAVLASLGAAERSLVEAHLATLTPPPPVVPVVPTSIDAFLAGLGATERALLDAHLASLTAAPAAPVVPTTFDELVAGLGAAERTLVEAHLASLPPAPAAPVVVPTSFDAVLAGLGDVERSLVEAHLASLPPAPAAPVVVPTNFDALLAGLDTPARTLVDDHIAGLKTALTTERTERKKAERQYATAAPLAEELPSVKAQVVQLTTDLATTRQEADFYVSAVDNGVKRKSLRLAFLASRDAGLSAGAWDALRTQYPDLFDAPPAPPPLPNSSAGAGTGRAPRGARSINQMLRTAAGRGGN